MTAEYLPVALNKEANFQSQAVRDSSEWKLDPKVFSNNMQEMGGSRHRYFCFQNFSSGPNIHIMEVGSIPQGKRRFSNNLGQPKRICFPPFCTNRSNLEQSAKGESDFVANYPNLANTIIMVSTTVTTHSANTITSTTNLKPLSTSNQRKESLDRAKELTTPGIDSLREILHAEGVLEGSSALITNARRSGANAHYESAWRKWNSWCFQRQVDPIKCSVNKILQFLTECFNMGYEHSTLAGFRSASRHTMIPLTEFQLGKNCGYPFFW